MLFTKKERTMGNIMEVKKLNNYHFLIYSFETKDGIQIQGMSSREEPLEYILTKQGIKNIVNQQKPIPNIKIIYHKKNPYDFYANYL